MLANPFLINLATLTRARTDHEWAATDIQYLIEVMFDTFHDWDACDMEHVWDAGVDWSEAREAVEWMKGFWARTGNPPPAYDVDAVVLMLARMSGQFNAIEDMPVTINLRAINSDSQILPINRS